MLCICLLCQLAMELQVPVSWAFWATAFLAMGHLVIGISPGKTNAGGGPRGTAVLGLQYRGTWAVWRCIKWQPKTSGDPRHPAPVCEGGRIYTYVCIAHASSWQRPWYAPQISWLGRLAYPKIPCFQGQVSVLQTCIANCPAGSGTFAEANQRDIGRRTRGLTGVSAIEPDATDRVDGVGKLLLRSELVLGRAAMLSEPQDMN